MEEEKRIKFSAEGNGLFNFIKQAKASFEGLQREGKNLADMLAAQAKAEGLAGKEAFRFTQDILKGMKEQLKIQKELTKEKLEQNKLWQDELVGNNNKWAQEERRKAEIEGRRLNDQMTLLDERGKSISQAGTISSRNQQDSTPSRQSFFNDMIKSGLFRDMMGALRQTVSASTGLDLLPTMFGATGSVMGGMTGAGIDALVGAKVLGSGLGDIHASTVLSALGKDLANTAGQGIVRHITEKEKYEAAAYGVMGLTGGPSRAGNLSMYGIDRTGGANLEQSIVRAIGVVTTQDQIRNVAAIGKFGNIDQASILGLMRTSRMGGNYNEKDIIQMYAEGMNRSQLNEGTQKLTSILQHQSQYLGELKNTNAISRIQIGDRLGGPFSTIDPRSAELEVGYMSRLQKPSGSFEQAISFAALQKAFPGRSLLEYKKLQQAGGVDYERAVLDIYGGMTGNEGLNTMMYSSSGFGLGAIDIDERRLAGRSKFTRGLMLQPGQSGDIDQAMSQVYSDAEKLTSEMQKNIASVNDAFVVSFTKGINEIAIQFGNRMREQIETFILNDENYKKTTSDLMGFETKAKNNLNSLKGKKTTQPTYTGDLDIYGNLVRD